MTSLFSFCQALARQLRGVIAGVLAVAMPALAGTAAAAAPEMLPNRVFTCDVGHVVNFDPHIAQAPTDLRFDSHSRLVFTLPVGPRRTRPAPDVTDPPEPVPANAQIIEDPAHIAPQRHARFDQVVDLWPERIETMGMIDAVKRNAIVIDGIDPAAGRANLFMLRATEISQFDAGAIFQGACRVTYPTRLPAPVRQR